ncbi:MAG: hypothetical protein ACM3PU_04985 [Gemmatimonadota bacterium]
MRNDDRFEFDPGPQGPSQLPAVLLAIVAIVAILLVNSGTVIPEASASARPARSAGFKLMPALLQFDEGQIPARHEAPGCESGRNSATSRSPLRT